jgi:predicted TIM-barrel fold metal-dependent hydrolase
MEGTTSERLISADSHVRVAHEQVKQHLAAKYHDAYDAAVAGFAARMARGPGAANQQWQKRKAAEGNAAFTRPGYWDPAERLKDMDHDGVDVEVIYSEVSAFRYLGEITEGQDESVRAFNDVLHGFASVDPKRLVVSYQIPIHDIDLAVAEVERVVGLGAKSLQIPVFPSEFGLPEYFDDRYEPLFGLIQETGLPLCCHIGLNTNLDDVARRDPTPNMGVMVPLTPLMTAEAFGMWIMGGVFEKFPGLRVVFVEPGLTWVAWWLDIVDDMVRRQGYEFPAISELPSTYYHRNVHLTFIDEALGLHRVRDLLGVENLLWSTDFPHPVTSWPNSRRIVEEQFAEVPADERELILSGNATRVWNL